MGLFGGKKDNGKDEDTSRSPRKSRRVVAPVAKPGAAKPPAPAQPPPQQPPAPQAPQQPQTTRSTIRPQQPVAAPRPPSGRVMKPSAPLPSQQRQAESGRIAAPPQRPMGKAPITAGSSRPPEFTGDLGQSGRRGDGPCRTGDAALLDFLMNKAHLLDAGQVGQVRGKAETEGLQIDVAAVELEFITEEQMVNALTQECWVPHLKVDKYEIRKKALDTIAREDAVHYGVFPVDKLGSLLTLAMVNPLDAETIRVLESKTGLDIKKVVATRTEITQGIEKYYSGQVQAKDSTLAFTQDVEPKSVTQMMSRVAPSSLPPAPPSRPIQAVKKEAPPPPPPPSSFAADNNIVPEIQDIDDLLSSDEAIAPAIIEPISLKAEEAEIVPVEPIEMEPLEAEPLFESPPNRMPSGEFSVADAPASGQDTLTPKPAPSIAPEFEFEDSPAPRAPAPAARAPIAPEFDDDMSPAITPPAAKAPPAPRAPAPPPPVAPSRPVPPPARPPTSSFERAADPKPATSRFSGTARVERSGVINLIPVTEEEFQHAITHGKSHMFEKWVGLQSRNRIINVVSVENEFDSLLEGLYAGARAV